MLVALWSFSAGFISFPVAAESIIITSSTTLFVFLSSEPIASGSFTYLSAAYVAAASSLSGVSVIVSTAAALKSWECHVSSLSVMSIAGVSLVTVVCTIGEDSV